ncbi:MAG: Acyl-CoA dehydrogenase, short-chain specific, partial [uncultured Rubrobacteraceae bacterium]
GLRVGGEAEESKGTRGRFRRPRGRAARRGARPRGPGPLRDAREALRDGVHGALRSGRVRRGGRGLPLLLPPDRRDQPGRRRGGRDARGPHERRNAPDTALRHGGTEYEVVAAARPRGEDRLLRPHRTENGLRRSRDRDEGREGRGRVQGKRAQAVDHERPHRRHHDPLRPRPGGRDGLRRPAGRRRPLLRQAREEDGRHLSDHRRRAAGERLRPRRGPAGGRRKGARRRAWHARPWQDRDSRPGRRHRGGGL